MRNEMIRSEKYRAPGDFPHTSKGRRRELYNVYEYSNKEKGEW